MRRGSVENSFTGCKITFYAVPTSRGAGAQGRPFGKAHHVLPAERQPGSPAPHRRGISGVQRRALVGGMPHLFGKDARSGGRHDHRADNRRCDDAGGHRRLRGRDDGSRPGRLHHQHGREPVPRPAPCAEFHAAPRLPIRRRRVAVRAGHHPHLRRPVSGLGAARDRRLRSRFSRPIEAGRSHHHLRAALSHRAGPAEEISRDAKSTQSWRARRWPACRFTRRRPETARSA